MVNLKFSKKSHKLKISKSPNLHVFLCGPFGRKKNQDTFENVWLRSVGVVFLTFPLPLDTMLSEDVGDKIFNANVGPN